MAEIVYTVQPVMEALEARLGNADSLAILNPIVTKYQSNSDHIYVRRGRAKVQDQYPVIGLEIQAKNEEWGALNWTKDITITVDVFVMVKAVGGTSTEAKASLAIEDYIIELGETVHGLLNERNKQQFPNIDGQGMSIYDSFAKEASYEWMYKGAVRAAKMPWFAKLWLYGNPPGNPLGGFSN